MEISIGDIIKHRRNMDVAYLLFNEQADKDGERGFYCYILNQGYTKTWMLNATCFIPLSTILSGEWLKCENTAAICIRDCNWSTL